MSKPTELEVLGVKLKENLLVGLHLGTLDKSPVIGMVLKDFVDLKLTPTRTQYQQRVRITHDILSYIQDFDDYMKKLNYLNKLTTLECCFVGSAGIGSMIREKISVDILIYAEFSPPYQSEPHYEKWNYVVQAFEMLFVSNQIAHNGYERRVAIRADHLVVTMVPFNVEIVLVPCIRKSTGLTSKFQIPDRWSTAPQHIKWYRAHQDNRGVMRSLLRLFKKLTATYVEFAAVFNQWSMIYLTWQAYEQSKGKDLQSCFVTLLDNMVNDQLLPSDLEYIDLLPHDTSPYISRVKYLAAKERARFVRKAFEYEQYINFLIAPLELPQELIEAERANIENAIKYLL